MAFARSMDDRLRDAAARAGKAGAGRDVAGQPVTGPKKRTCPSSQITTPTHAGRRNHTIERIDSFVPPKPVGAVSDMGRHHRRFSVPSRSDRPDIFAADTIAENEREQSNH
jgi:hypothetical protein